MAEWIHACACDDIEIEDLVRWDHGTRTFAIYNTGDGFFAPTACARTRTSISRWVF